MLQSNKIFIFIYFIHTYKYYAFVINLFIGLIYETNSTVSTILLLTTRILSNIISYDKDLVLFER